MTTRRSSRRRVEFGDWQTPVALARRVVALLAAQGVEPGTVVEPTCGDGSFLVAAAERWPQADAWGYDVDPTHVAHARAALPQARIERADFFGVSWEAVLRPARAPVLILGNPPWVTSAELGALGSHNLPRKDNPGRLTGLDAITGRANFDVSEWMLLRLLEALDGVDFTLAMLCKAIVARRMMEHVARARWPLAGVLHDIDAMMHFGAAVDAVLLTVRSEPGAAPSRELRWPRHASLESPTPSTILGVTGQTVTCDADAFERTRHLQGQCEPQWRSGLKHDCASVMELQIRDERLVDRSGAPVDLEDDYLFPLLKGSDVANRRWPPSRCVLVPQQALGDDTWAIAGNAPRTWAYLQAHRAELDGRKSSIYRGQPPFAVFGVGTYAFAPWKIAIAGLYKRLTFSLVGPHLGKPVVFDDTTYFLPFGDEASARQALAALRSPEAAEFFAARVFWDDKRPINKRVLQSLDLAALQRRLGLAARPRERAWGQAAP